MAVGTIKTGKHGRNRALGIKTWLGAGALTVGVGAALAAGSGVAQADTGGHQASSSASSSSSNKPAAGPKRSGGVASTKRVAAPVKAASSTPSAADTKSAAASPAAGQTQTTTQTVNTPFGKITVDISATLPNAGTSGPVSLNLNASTPLGNVKFSLSGDSTFSPTPTITENVSITQGTFVVPAPVALLVSSAGSAVLGAYSAYTSATTFFSALQHGNVVGAAQAWLEGGPKLANALLFGQKALTLPIDLGEGAGTAQLSIPFGGFFAPLKPISVTWPGYSYTDQTSGAQVTIDPVDVSFAGTRFGGVGQALLQLFGLA